jgi:hypothetical protein
MTLTRYRHPSSGGFQVTSPHQARSTRSGSNSRPTGRGGRCGGVGAGQAAAPAGPVADDAVGAHQPLDPLVIDPRPRRRNSACTRGAPSVPPERAWMRRISPTNLPCYQWHSDDRWATLVVQT